MQIILQEDVKNLGKKGDVVKVAEGYARNYLIPKGKAVAATKGALAHMEKHRKTMDQLEKEKEAQALLLKVKLEEADISIKVKAGETGRLFGSVTSNDIAAALRQEGLQVDKRKIEMAEPIRTLGEHNVSIRVFRETAANLVVKVIGE